MYASNEFCFVFLYVNRTLLFLKLKTQLFAQRLYLFTYFILGGTSTLDQAGRRGSLVWRGHFRRQGGTAFSTANILLSQVFSNHNQYTFQNHMLQECLNIFFFRRMIYFHKFLIITANTLFRTLCCKNTRILFFMYVLFT